MKIKKWYITLGIILLSLAFSNLNLDAPGSPSVLELLVALVVYGLIGGFMNLLRFVIQFALSWQGVLLLFIILMYKAWKQYLEAKLPK